MTEEQAQKLIHDVVTSNRFGHHPHEPTKSALERLLPHAYGEFDMVGVHDATETNERLFEIVTGHRA